MAQRKVKNGDTCSYLRANKELELSLMLLEVEHRLQNSCHISTLHCKKLKHRKPIKIVRKIFTQTLFYNWFTLLLNFFFHLVPFFHLKCNFLHKETYFAINEKGKQISLNMNQTGSAVMPAANMQANTWPKNPTAELLSRYLVSTPAGYGFCLVSRGILRISSDGDDQRIIFGFDIFDSGIFSGRKIWKVFFWWLDLSRDFLEYSNNLKIRGSANVYV